MLMNSPFEFRTLVIKELPNESLPTSPGTRLPYVAELFSIREFTLL